jgi:hypothetical protein
MVRADADPWYGDFVLEPQESTVGVGIEASGSAGVGTFMLIL